jgi:CHASE3 domain sensor protein
MKMAVQQKIQAGFAVALALPLLTGVSAWWSAQRNMEVFRPVKHTHEVRDKLEATLVEMLNAFGGGAGIRGFATSGDNRAASKRSKFLSVRWPRRAGR